MFIYIYNVHIYIYILFPNFQNTSSYCFYFFQIFKTQVQIVFIFSESSKHKFKLFLFFPNLQNTSSNRFYFFRICKTQVQIGFIFLALQVPQPRGHIHTGANVQSSLDSIQFFSIFFFRKQQCNGDASKWLSDEGVALS